MKLKKSLSLSLVVTLLVCTLFVPSVYAASPVVVDGVSQVLFDQSFGGLSGASDLTDFSVSGGSWNYTKHFMIAHGGGTHTVFTKANYDVSNAEEWTFTAKASCTFNGYYIKLAYDETNKKGYTLCYSYNTKKLALYKDAVPTNATSEDASTDDMAAYVALDAYGSDNTITVNYVKATNTLTVKNSVNSNVITYTPEDNSIPNLNGKFGIDDSSAGVFTLFNMKLEKSTGDITVNNWRYEKYFSNKDTFASLADEGITFNWDSPVINADNVQYNTSGRTSEFAFKPHKQNFAGDWAVEFKTSKGTTYHNIYFNYIDENNYYVMIPYRSYSDTNKGKVIINKYVDGVATEVYNASYGDPYIPNSVIMTYTIQSKANGTSRDYTMTIYSGNNSKSHTFTYTDESPFASNGYIKCTGAGASKLYYIKANSLMSEGETALKVKYSEEIMNKTFSSADTNSSLEAEGITFSSAAHSMNDTDGILCSGGGVQFIYNNDNLGDEYSFNAYLYRGVGYSSYYFNYVDSSNYYRIYVGAGGSSSMYCKLYKCVNGTEEEVASTTPTWNNHGRNAWSTLTVTLNKNVVKGMDISATYKQDGKTALALTYTDETPISTGSIRLSNTSSNGKVKSFAISHSYEESYADSTSFSGIFYKDAGVNAIKEMIKGPVYFRHPTAVLNNHIAVAALYEDHKMTDIKTFQPAALYNETVKLFDTTNSTAEDIKIRVYFFDSDETLNKLTEVYELN